jgi:hypothetical protein
MTEPRASARQIREAAERVKKNREAELALTRARATSWAKGTGGILATGLAFGTIRGRSNISELQPYVARWVGGLLLAAMLIGIVAVFFFFRAAYGRLTPIPPETTDHTLAAQTMKDVRVGLGVAALGTTLLVTAVGLTWYGPSRAHPHLVVVDEGGTSWCGDPIRTVDGLLTLNANGQEVQVSLAEAVQIRPVTTCP